MADFGLIQGISAGLREGVNSYRSERDRQDRLAQEALDRKMKQAAFDFEKQKTEETLAAQRAKTEQDRISSQAGLMAGAMEKGQRIGFDEGGLPQFQGYLPPSPEKQADIEYKKGYLRYLQEKPKTDDFDNYITKMKLKSEFETGEQKKQTQVPGFVQSDKAVTTPDDAKKLKDTSVITEKVKLRAQKLRNLVDAAGGFAVMPGKMKRDIQQAYTDLQLSIKDYERLGVLAGPDMGLIIKSIPDPSSWSESMLSGYDKSGLLNAIDSVSQGAEDALASEGEARGYIRTGLDKNIVGEDAQAIEWAKSNPNDPRAKKIMEMHSIGGN